MSDNSYPWKRFWSPLGTPSRFDDGGFLTDPESDWGRYANPDLMPFDAIMHLPCQVLLGEPGMGKSCAMWDAYAALRTYAPAHWIDLKDYSSDATLHSIAFGDDVIRDWRNGSYHLHLFIDSLDEGALAIDALANALKRELRALPTARLSLYVACRTLDWPMNLQDALVGQWGKESIAVYELAPLRRVDVTMAATIQGVNGDTFLHEVERLNVVPFAMRPITLDALLTQYADTGVIGTNKPAIYHAYCRRLCRELNPDRIAAGFVGEYDADERMAVAARIAAVTIFANRIGIWSDPLGRPLPEGYVAVEDLYGDLEPIASRNVEVKHQFVHEALSTGLFKSPESGRITWAHRTIEEYLAAYFLAERAVGLDQIRSLLFHSSDPQHKLVPQLHQAAAWLAEMNRQVFTAIMASDPGILLRSNVGIAAVEDRAALVTTLLQSCDDRTLIDTLGLRAGYANLAHPGLSDQLESYLVDRQRRDTTREAAIVIAGACSTAMLFPVIIAIALDPVESLSSTFPICMAGQIRIPLAGQRFAIASRLFA